MQYHIEDYLPGDPDIKPALPGLSAQKQSSLQKTADVVVVGCGPAGLTMSAQLAAFPDIDLCVVEKRTGPMERGQADGVACRTVEMFNAFGFAHKVLRESCWVNETNFWKTHDDPSKGIYRSGRVKDTEEGLSEFPHVIVNQARVQELYLDILKNSPRKTEPFYRRSLVSVKREEGEYPVIAEFDYEDESGNITRETIRTKYLVGGDGARSITRQQLGLELKGDSTNQAWGVMDILARTDFPDVRKKSIINSASGGTVVVIPREGGYLFRVYVEMDKLGDGERVRSRSFDSSDVIAAANKVFHPYTLDVQEVAWWSVYEIGQRMTDRFDDALQDKSDEQMPRIFIAGDACHTHSPKAGQGMNVSMQDTFNLGWKLAYVLKGRSKPDLLCTYTEERHAIAKNLIDFDREWSGLLHKASKGDDSVTPEEVQQYFVRSGHYTAGTATHYSPSRLTGNSEHQALASGLTIGKRFHSSPVIRQADAKPMQLAHTVQADGRWRVFVFTPKTAGVDSALDTIASLGDFFENNPSSPVTRFTPKGDELDSIIDIRLVLPFHFSDFETTQIPDFFFPRKGKLELRDYEKTYCFSDKDETNFYKHRGIDEDKGCMVVVRPDQYVSQVLPLTATTALADFFASFLEEN